MLRAEGPDDARNPVRIAAIVESMGYIARPAEGAGPVARWFGAGALDELSQEEASILAERWTNELFEEGVVGRSAGLSSVLASALLKTFRDAARTGQIGMVDLDVSSLRQILDDEESRGVRAWVRTRLGYPTA